MIFGMTNESFLCNRDQVQRSDGSIASFFNPLTNRFSVGYCFFFLTEIVLSVAFFLVNLKLMIYWSFRMFFNFKSITLLCLDKKTSQGFFCRRLDETGPSLYEMEFWMISLIPQSLENFISLDWDETREKCVSEFPDFDIYEETNSAFLTAVYPNF